MEVLVKLPEDLYKYFEYIPVESLPEVMQDLVRSALQMKLESGLEDKGQTSSDEVLKNLLSQISTIAGNSNDIQKKLNIPLEVSTTKQESSKPSTEVKYIASIVCDENEDEDEDAMGDFFK